MIKVTRNSRDIDRVVGAVDNLTNLLHGTIPRDECSSFRRSCSTMICNKISKLELIVIAKSEKSDERWEVVLKHMQHVSDFMIQTRRQNNTMEKGQSI